MGYGNPDLEEVEDDKLLRELARRIAKLTAGICPYCGRDISSSTRCLHSEQHKHTAHAVTKPQADQVIGAVATLLERQS